MDYLLKGMFIGIVFGLPAGVIGALTIQRTIERGFLYGFITGLGSTAADMIYASMGIFGLRIVSDFLLEYREGIRLMKESFWWQGLEQGQYAGEHCSPLGQSICETG